MTVILPNHTPSSCNNNETIRTDNDGLSHEMIDIRRKKCYATNIVNSK
jgi:hypothetical protein